VDALESLRPSSLPPLLLPSSRSDPIALYIYRWGKFWLALLNVHSWRGLNPTPAELWLLPDYLPIHPWRWWIHTRNVYIPMGYLSGKGWQAEVDETILSLREVSFLSLLYLPLPLLISDGSE